MLLVTLELFASASKHVTVNACMCGVESQMNGHLNEHGEDFLNDPLAIKKF